MKKTFRIIFDVEGDTCAEYKDLVDKFMLKQMHLAEELVKNVDQDEILKQSRMIITMANEFYHHTEYEHCALYCNKKGEEYLDASVYDKSGIKVRGQSGVTKEEWNEFIKESREKWEESKKEYRQRMAEYENKEEN